MQPFLRYASRSIFDTNATRQAPSSIRRLSSRSFRAAVQLYKPTCQPLRLSQRRHFADDEKLQGSSKIPIHLGSPPNNPGSSSLTPSTSSEPPNISTTSPNTPPAQAQEPPEVKPVSHHDDEALSHNLPSSSESRRSLVSKRFSHLMENVQGNIFVASQRLNDLTGYSGIEALKQRITILEDTLSESQEAVRIARQHYKDSIADRAASQREVNSLLSRKESWTPVDVERFTSLYRSDHGNELSVQEAATKLADAERASEQAASKLSSSILSRYHEEQIWSDKIRQMSTWGTWGLMGVNVLLFLVFQFGFEPWRRARLVRGFEDKVREALEREKARNAHKDNGMSFTGNDGDNLKLDAVIAAGIEELEGETAQETDPVVDALAVYIEGDAPESEYQTATLALAKVPGHSFDWRSARDWKIAISGFPDSVRRTFAELFSEQPIAATQQDVTIIALEGAAMGAGLVAMLFMILSGPN